MKTVCWCQTAHHIQYVHLKTTEGQTATLSNVEQNIFWMRWDLKGTELKAIYSKVFVLSLTFTKETEAHLHLQTTSSFLKKKILVLLIYYIFAIIVLLEAPFVQLKNINMSVHIMLQNG